MSEFETYRKAGSQPQDQRQSDDEDETDFPARAERHSIPVSAFTALRHPAPVAKSPFTDKPAVADNTPAAPAADAAKGQEVIKSEAEPPKPKPGRRRAFLAALLLIGIGVGAYYGHHWWTVGRFLVSTDDAYVKADMSVIAAKAAGYVDSVPKNEPATAGVRCVRAMP